MPTTHPFTVEYQTQVVDLICTVQQEFGIAITIADQPDLLNIPAVYQVGQGNFWVAIEHNQDHGQVIGTIALIDIGQNQGALRKMFVHRDYRRQQVGQQLLNAVLQWVVQTKIQEIYLGTTEQFQAAHRFYEKNGFTQIQRSQLPPNFPLMLVDTRFYQYRSIEIFEEELSQKTLKD